MYCSVAQSRHAPEFPCPPHPPTLLPPPSSQLGYNAEFFSCADLAALLAEAQLAAVHEALEGEGAAPLASPAAPPVILRRHLEAALAEVRPSVAEAERERLEAVYARFRQDREPGGGGAAALDKGKGKVTWA